MNINIAKDFTLYPGARYRSDGKYSGEEFYEDILKPQLLQIWNKKNVYLTINFDGTFGYASSFISEVFIRVVSDFKDKNKIKKKIHLITNDDPLLKNLILQTIDETNI